MVPLLVKGAGCAYLGAGEDAGGTGLGVEGAPGKYLVTHQKEGGKRGPQELYTLSPSTVTEGCIAVMWACIRLTLSSFFFLKTFKMDIHLVFWLLGISDFFFPIEWVNVRYTDGQHERAAELCP